MEAKTRAAWKSDSAVAPSPIHAAAIFVSFLIADAIAQPTACIYCVARFPESEKPVQRSYTLSVAPSDGCYRISVKREGVVSTHLHGLRVGDLIEARTPAGGFTIDAAERRPAVLLGAGVGITPMLAMRSQVV